MTNKTIIIIQAFAAALMGSNYFMSKDIRDKINRLLKNYFSGVKNRSSNEFTIIWQFALENKWKTIFPNYIHRNLCWSSVVFRANLDTRACKPSFIFASSVSRYDLFYADVNVCVKQPTHMDFSGYIDRRSCVLFRKNRERSSCCYRVYGIDY